MLSLSCTTYNGPQRNVFESTFEVTVKPSSLYAGGVSMEDLTAAIQEKLRLKDMGHVKVST